MLGLMDEQSSPSVKAIVALQAKEGLAPIGAMSAQMRIIFAPIQKANFAERARQVRGLTASHVVNHLLHLIALEIAANAVVYFAAGLDGARIFELQ